MRWLGITVGADPEISPRTRLVSVPYAYNAQNAAFADSALYVSDNYVKLKGDTMIGDLKFDNDALGIDIWLDNTTGDGGNVRLMDDGNYSAILYGDRYGTLVVYNDLGQGVGYVDGNLNGGGVLQLNQQDGTAGANFNGGTSADGSTLTMYSAGGSSTIKLDADIVGNGAAVLPDSAISSAEMWNEPGLAANNTTSGLNLTIAMTDQATVTVTIPTAGYVLLFGKAFFSMGGTRGTNYAYAQIDETSGGGTDAPYYVAAGTDSAISTGSLFYPIAVQRVYYKASAGSYTFRLEAMEYPTNGAGANTICYHPMLTAVYLPTSYGTVNTFLSAAQRGEFETSEAVATDTPAGPADPSGQQTLYQVDLRELEMRAVKAQAEAERMQRELMEARLQQQLEGSTRR
ncbi:hypothetical protein C3F09_11525 [candidate division GN15 bacterium]|uniref:Uncharacterized protein n=1 Tax=candidate division GN15 bacterium TaxID=2072418 RepID=A0A855WYF0_9BACT|nr:MAG: hypothetical protein C3F09_11525 [candidate division GN15 bacterium]